MAKKSDLDIANSVTPVLEAPNVAKPSKEIVKEKIQELIKQETRLVKGVFQSFETPGATVTVTYRKYPGIPVFRKEMTDGMTYEVPLYIARFLNGIDVSAGALGDPSKRNQNVGTCGYGVHGFKTAGDELVRSTMGVGPAGEGGIPVPIVGITSRKRRYGFQSMEFGGEE